ncbi:hypothetical protein HELRODRAFT_88593 [Helobdella robusta]|uniref:Complex III subunit 9 n=1 Tax=Helobdella robusta TaxID=6412 RepID=T1G742_HELRO|nr:hypothetical protein HELRODRAFT_88593 [Helobdella robusta]ESN93557.1 hypothetical protein HELRODRAFT_88593 [Helobdella robusta]
MALGSVYNVLFKRTSTFALTCLVGAFVFERFFDQMSDSIFERINQGKLFKHIKKADAEGK